MSVDKFKQLQSELRAMGVGAVGLRSPEARELAKMLHPDEKIGGVVYGRSGIGLSWLVATDKRVIYIDKKIFYTTIDELTYDVVSGVSASHAIGVASIVLHTKVNDYVMRFVSPKSARIFVKFIESRRLESGWYDESTEHFQQTNVAPPTSQIVGDEGLNFLKSHDLAVLSTIDRTGNVYGAVVYYIVDGNNTVYILTKTGTGKGRNVYAHSQVALTVHEPGTMQTLQLQGNAEVETNQLTKENVFSLMVKPRPYRKEMKLPPVTKLHEGEFMIIRIAPTFMSFHDYAKDE